jgi:large subunit ribosomal protein L18
MNQAVKNHQRQQIRNRIRAKLSGSSQRPRLHVSISHTAVVAQLIDDQAGRTLAMVSSRQAGDKVGSTMTEKATWVGAAIAEKAAKAKLTTVVFDRGLHRYHGRVKALGEAARANGLKF